MGNPTAEKLRRHLISMLRPRIIPCLLVRNGGLVKTVNFGADKYVGDPINAVRIFNEKEVDEIMVIDIDATAQRREPSYDLVRKLAAECRMPLCYGGGVKTVDQYERLVELGVEKISVSSAAVENPGLISAAAEMVGRQSVVVVMDVKKAGPSGSYQLHTHNGRLNTGISPIEFARRMATLGAGEIVINNIDRDGVMKGYDLDLIAQVRDSTDCPMTVLGGAGSPKDIAAVISRFGTIGVAAGSLFVFKGVYRAVLINYPSRVEKDALLKTAAA
jgi:cyclase